MMDQLVKADQPTAVGVGSIAYNKDQLDLIKRTIAKGATDDELKLFLYQAQRQGLDPLAKQIYFQKRRNKHGEDNITIITAIDGYRSIAESTGQYAGNDDPVFDNEENPRKATVTVYKLVGGIRCGFMASARWDEYYPGDALGFMWRKMPCTMLGKCAEALALRKAFPKQLSGLYIREEMDQAGPTIESVPKVEEKKKGYDGSKDQAEILKKLLISQKVDEAVWEEINDKMMGKNLADLKGVITEVCGK